MNSGIYKIVNKNNGKCYAGSAIDVDRRWFEHKKALRKGEHHSILLQRAWNKHGEETFDFVLVENVEKEYLISKEQILIDEKSEYNVCKIAGSRLGSKCSEETLEKMRKAKGGENNTFYGKHHSEESKRKMSEARKGKPSFWKGKALPLEMRQKISASRMGLRPSEETRKKLSLAKLGNKNRFCVGNAPWNKGMKMPFKSRTRRSA